VLADLRLQLVLAVDGRHGRRRYGGIDEGAKIASMPNDPQWVQAVRRLRANADPDLWRSMAFDLETSAMALDLVLDTLASRRDLSPEQRDGLLEIGVEAAKRHHRQIDALADPGALGVT
jgi:hypothetical protein